MSTLKTTNITHPSSASNNIVLDSSGRVGLGTSTSPLGQLEIYRTSATDPSLRLRYNDVSYYGDHLMDVNGNYVIYSPTANGVTSGNLRLRAAGVFSVSTNNTAVTSAALTVDASSRLLVGTSTAPSIGQGQYSKLVVQAYVGNATGAGTMTLQRGQAAASIASGDRIGELNFTDSAGATYGMIYCDADAAGGTNDYPGRLVFSTTADGASSPTERMRITNAGVILGGNTSVNGSHPKAHLFRSTETTDGAGAFIIENSNTTNGTSIFVGVGAAAVGYNASNCVLGVYRCSSNSRSINAAGSINASGADYAEYMTKAGDFTIAKGDVCGVDASGKLTNIFADSIGFLVKSTDPSYVGGDTWGLGFEDDQEGLEVARQQVDRIAFAGQVPVNVIGATPGQYIVPVEAADGGIEGIAKNKSDMTAAEYMDAVGKVIAIEDDGRARIIVKVA